MRPRVRVSVPLFAQAAGAKLTYLAQEKPSPTAQAIFVPKNSPIAGLSDLKGKRIGLAKAAGVHYLALRAIEAAGLSRDNVEIAELQPADGRIAFEKGAIAACAAPASVRRRPPACPARHRSGCPAPRRRVAGTRAPASRYSRCPIAPRWSRRRSA
ncbi:hypothetical protein CH337_21030 [Rhodoblastus acidophilus]|nr:hypothetical protein CKO16_16380 [Rhodoblastus acidophilus]RAI16503.1 hypothetical protein CH337_21030 [Rhodoblastus acidophilus]